MKSLVVPSLLCITKLKTTLFTELFLVILNIIILAGCKSGAGNPLTIDLILLGQKLAKLGFICSKGQVIVLTDYEQGR